MSARPLRWATAALAAFLALAVLVQTGWIASLDRAIFRRLYSGESEWPMGPTSGRSNELLQALLPWFDRAAYGRNLVLLVVVMLGLLVALQWWRAAAFFAGAVSVVLLAAPLKELFNRPSPFPLPGQPSFPSGHATLTMAIAAAAIAIAIGSRGVWVVIPAAVALVVSVGVAAVADSGHWPTDIAAGWSLALAWVLSLRALVRGSLRGALPRRPRARLPVS